MSRDNLAIDKVTRMEALECLYISAGNIRWGISGGHGFHVLVAAIVEDRRTTYLSPRMLVVKEISEKLEVWSKLQMYIDKTGDAWKNFTPPEK